MSRFDWEEGSIKIPSAEWAALKKKVREAFNHRQEKLYEVGVSVWEKVKEEKKGKRGYPTYEKAREALYNAEIERHFIPQSRYASPKRRRSLTEYEIHSVLECLFRGTGEKRQGLYKPRKKDFPRKTNRDVRFQAGWEAWIDFDNNQRLANWQVEENNRAVEKARRDMVAQAFFRALGAVRWTRKSGGTIYGNDEYNRDARSGPGAGGHYVTDSYGPLGG